jgi:hypothetical protein
MKTRCKKAADRHYTGSSNRPGLKPTFDGEHFAGLKARASTRAEICRQEKTHVHKPRAPAKANAGRKASGLPGRRRRKRLSYIFVRDASGWRDHAKHVPGHPLNVTSKRGSSTDLPGSTSRRPGSPFWCPDASRRRRIAGHSAQDDDVNAGGKASGLPGRGRRERLSYILVRDAGGWPDHAKYVLEAGG